MLSLSSIANSVQETSFFIYNNNGCQEKKIPAASARTKAHIPYFQITVGLLTGFCGYAYLAMRAPPSKICGSPGGPPVTSPRVKLDDGRHLSYKEMGVPKEEAKHKIIVVHGFDDSKNLYLPLSQEVLKELQIYILSFDRAGYGESDPNPARSVKSEAFDIQEIADKLQLGSKFHVLGMSMGAYPVWSCLKYIPNRLAGAALVVPFVNYWWKLPANLADKTLKKLLVQDQRTLRVAHYAPWLFHWWMTQKWFPTLSILEGRTDVLSSTDLEILKRLSVTPKEGQEKIRQQGVFESLHRDIIAGYGKWEFDPVNLSNPFPNKEGSVHIWQGYEDKFIPFELNRYLSQKLPWIQYHEVPDAGHLLFYSTSYCEAIIKSLVSSSE